MVGLMRLFLLLMTPLLAVASIPSSDATYQLFHNHTGIGSISRHIVVKPTAYALSTVTNTHVFMFGDNMHESSDGVVAFNGSQFKPKVYKVVDSHKGLVSLVHFDWLKHQAVLENNKIIPLPIDKNVQDNLSAQLLLRGLPGKPGGSITIPELVNDHIIDVVFKRGLKQYHVDSGVGPLAAIEYAQVPDKKGNAVIFFFAPKLHNLLVESLVKKKGSVEAYAVLQTIEFHF